jgi:hypothetical protein
MKSDKIFRINAAIRLTLFVCLIPEALLYASNFRMGNASGILAIPTAYTAYDREIIFGAGYLPARYAYLHGTPDQIYYITIGYLPFLETTFALVHSDRIGNVQGIGDRVGHFRFKIISERRKFPAIVLGLRDPFGLIGEQNAQQFNTSYLVASKSLHLPNHVNMVLHLGYGTDWIRAAQHQLVGVFGGLAVYPERHVAFLLEHDTKKFNFGIRTVILGKTELVISWLNFDAFSGGISYNFKL